jgi:transcriptional regulator with XRE-family HTH domain
LYDLRTLGGLSQQELADGIGISLSGYQRWESGFVARPNVAHLAKAAEILETTVAYLLTGEASISADALAGLRSDMQAMAARLEALSAQLQQRG